MAPLSCVVVESIRIPVNHARSSLPRHSLWWSRPNVFCRVACAFLVGTCRVMSEFDSVCALEFDSVCVCILEFDSLRGSVGLGSAFLRGS